MLYDISTRKCNGLASSKLFAWLLSILFFHKMFFFSTFTSAKKNYNFDPKCKKICLEMFDGNKIKFFPFTPPSLLFTEELNQRLLDMLDDKRTIQ